MRIRKRSVRTRVAVGVDGCPGGWLAVTEDKQRTLVARVVPTFTELIEMFPTAAVFGVDIPIGLPMKGARRCETEARQLLGWPRMTSVFSAPLRPCLVARTYEEACDIRFAIEGKRMSRQAYGILPKIREVDEMLKVNRTLAARVIEVHPEVSFLFMNDGMAMQYSKRTPPGKVERRGLLDSHWSSVIEGLRESLQGERYARDDLYDAMAALWSVRRWLSGKARVLGDPAVRDSKGLPMRIVG